MMIDIVDYLAYRPLKQSDLSIDRDDYLGKLTCLNLRNNLPDIIKDCYVFKVEDERSVGGKHIYVPIEKVDDFLFKHQTNMR